MIKTPLCISDSFEQLTFRHVQYPVNLILKVGRRDRRTFEPAPRRPLGLTLLHAVQAEIIGVRYDPIFLRFAFCHIKPSMNYPSASLLSPRIITSPIFKQFSLNF